MSVERKAAATALIERICDAHPDRDPEGPLVTVVDGVWAFCAGHADSGHQWRATDPVARHVLDTPAERA